MGASTRSRWIARGGIAGVGAFALAAVLFWSVWAKDGCLNDDRTGADRMSTKGVILTVTARKGDGDGSVLHFIVKNGSAVTVGLFVGFDFGDQPGAYLDVQGTSLHVRKVYLRTPTNYHSDDWFKPGQVILKPGDSHEQDIVLPQRVKAFNPLEEVKGHAPFIRVQTPTREAEVLRAVLHVGVFELEPRMQPRHHPMNPKWVEIWEATTAEQAEIEATVPLPGALTVLDYE